MISEYTVPARRRIKDKVFQAVCLTCLLVGVASLFIVLAGATQKGFGRFDLQFITDKLSTDASRTGAWNAVVGSLWVVGITVVVSVPLGIAAAIYIQELMGPSRFKTLLQTNVANLAGVPSIIYGILGLAVFVRGFNLGPTILAAGLTMAILVLPTIILVTQEALRMVPKHQREASLALGATRWQTILRQILPSAAPTIITGVILSTARALGETSPLFVVGAITFSRQVPDSLDDRFTVLPIQIYNWSSMPGAKFEPVVGAGIILLVGALLLLNLLAMTIRGKFSNQS